MTLARYASILLAAGVLCAQSSDTNPYTSEKDIAEGRRLYSLFCVFCHGMDGASGRGARLASTFRRQGTSDRDQFRVIANGVSGTEMSGHYLDEEEIWKILSFVRTLEAAAASRPAVCAATPGNPLSGRKIFESKGGCLACHSVNTGGRIAGSGRLGPELTHIGETHTREHLRESLLDPGRAVGPAWRQVRVASTAGAYRGILLNQDEYTLHLLDNSENIRSFQKAELRSIEFPAGSSMPPYRSLAPAELEDLLSYLCTLKGDAR